MSLSTPTISKELVKTIAPPIKTQTHSSTETTKLAKKKLGKCKNCQKPTSLQCSRCKYVKYCSKKCQKQAWKTHITLCNRIVELKDRTDAIQYSKKGDYSALLNLILNRNIDINTRDIRGRSLLTLLCIKLGKEILENSDQIKRSLYLQVIALMIYKGADRSIRDDTERLPYCYISKIIPQKKPYNEFIILIVLIDPRSKITPIDEKFMKITHYSTPDEHIAIPIAQEVILEKKCNCKKEVF